MSSRPQIKTPVIQDGDMSGNLTSKVTIIQKLSEISYSVTWAGTAPVGAVTVEVSNDYSQNDDGTVRNVGSWNPLPGVSGAVSGSPGQGFVDIFATGSYAMRLVYTRTSGSGLMQVILCAKVG